MGKKIPFSDEDKDLLEKKAKEIKDSVPTDPNERKEFFRKQLDEWQKDYQKRLEEGDIHDEETEYIKFMASMGITPEEYEKRKEEFENTKNIELDMGSIGSLLNFAQLFFEFLKG